MDRFKIAHCRTAEIPWRVQEFYQGYWYHVGYYHTLTEAKKAMFLREIYRLEEMSRGR
jgi:hypothetical protein